MRAALNMAKWDMVLQLRHHLYTATLVTTLTFCLAAVILRPLNLSPTWLALFLFADPATIGLSFVGAYLLIERGANTIGALSTTPISANSYVFGKVVSFCVLGFLSGIVIALVAAGGALNFALIIAALLLTNAVAVTIGFAVAAPSDSVNAFLARMSVTMVVLMTPVLSYLGVVSGAAGAALKIIPSYSMLVVLRAGFETGPVALADIAPHAAYLLFWFCLGWVLAVRAFDRHMRGAAT